MTDDVGVDDAYPWREFVASGSRTAKVATVRSDGRPHVAPVAFVLDGDDIVFITSSDSVKGKTLRRTGIASAAIDEELAPYPFVILDGAATLTEDETELRRWAPLIAERYVAAENVDAFVERNSTPGTALVRIRPDRVIARLNGQPRATLTFTGPDRSARVGPGNSRS